jgi:hypothetical protein
MDEILHPSNSLLLRMPELALGPIPQLIPSPLASIRIKEIHCGKPESRARRNRASRNPTLAATPCPATVPVRVICFHIVLLASLVGMPGSR